MPTQHNISLSLTLEEQEDINNFVKEYAAEAGGVPITRTSLVKHAVFKFINEWRINKQDSE